MGNSGARGVSWHGLQTGLSSRSTTARGTCACHPRAQGTSLPAATGTRSLQNCVLSSSGKAQAEVEAPAAPHPLGERRDTSALFSRGRATGPFPSCWEEGPSPPPRRLQIHFKRAASKQGESARRVISMRVFISFTGAASLCKATERV